jgi:hypothetical protein
MKSIYSPREEFSQSMKVWLDIQKTMKKNGYTNYVIVLAKDDPDNDDNILYDTHYRIADEGVLDVVKNLIENIEENIEEE